MILLSACLKGDNCRYNGETKSDTMAVKAFETGLFEPVCPEELGGLDTPRDPSEIVPDGSRRVFTDKGKDVTEAFREGALRSLEKAREKNCHVAVLKSRSPSCGCKQIYSGLHDGTIIEGQGITAELLMKNGIKVYNSDEADYGKLLVHDYLLCEGIPYETYEHDKVFTVEEAKATTSHIKAQHCKNLFLRNRKGNEHYLIIMPEDEPFDLELFRTRHYVTKPSFASKDRLFRYLGVEPGSVSVFGLLFDLDREVEVFISPEFDRNGRISFHPNSNDETLVLQYSDIEKFVKELGYELKEL